jgi:hypothetical protein
MTPISGVVNIFSHERDNYLMYSFLDRPVVNEFSITSTIILIAHKLFNFSTGNVCTMKTVMLYVITY